MGKESLVEFITRTEPHTLLELHRIFQESTQVLESNLTWADKYSLIFGEQGLASQFRKTLSEAHLPAMNYYDPDTSYREDVEAWYQAVLQTMGDPRDCS